LSNEDIRFGNDFVAWIIESGRLHLIDPASVATDDIILYCDSAEPKHAGRWNGALVVSKWGLGHLWKHRVFEVRASYGNIVRAFRGVSRPHAENWFSEYSNGST